MVKVPESAWLVASKVNRADLYNPLLNRTLTILAIAIAIVSLGAIIMQRLIRPLSDKVVEPAEQSRVESEKKYRALFESAGDGIFIMQQEYMIDCNQKTLDIFQCEREEFVGKTPKHFSPEKQPDGTNSQEKAIELITNAYKGETQFLNGYVVVPIIQFSQPK